MPLFLCFFGGASVCTCVCVCWFLFLSSFLPTRGHVCLSRGYFYKKKVCGCDMGAENSTMGELASDGLDEPEGFEGDPRGRTSSAGSDEERVPARRVWVWSVWSVCLAGHTVCLPGHTVCLPGHARSAPSQSQERDRLLRAALGGA